MTLTTIKEKRMENESIIGNMRDPMVHDLHLRVSRIEEKTRDTATEMAVLKNDLQYVKESVGGVLRGINKILWAIGLSVLGFIMTFLLSGGFSIVSN